MITVETIVSNQLNKVWDAWTNPEHIIKWNFASNDWHCPKAENDLRKDGKFSYTMAAKDGSFSFDFWGTHTNIEESKLIETILGDGRKMKVTFTEENGGVKVIEDFEPENENPIDLQKTGWQAILNNFKKHVESL
ncbi:SRPBCC family protein [Pedobacter alpinus]|uniref:SRPBCC family protein n=1 Tax=Pedobacter alpinus TaxID=1590643 RepID=A0ABW5TSP5_9SPHI